MNPSPHVEGRRHTAVLISLFVVMNMIWWMVMIAAIGLGATHLSRCPVQPNIPIYLIGLGAANLLSLSLTYSRTSWGEGTVSVMCASCTAVLHLFSFGWFIAGTYWIYPVYPPVYTPGASRYCDQTTYQFAFAVTTLVWVVSTLMFWCGGCFALLTCCKTVANAGPRLIPNRKTYGSTHATQEPAAGDV